MRRELHVRFREGLGVKSPRATRLFAFLHPKDNEQCVRAVAGYRACLSSESTFVPWTLETVVEGVKAEGGAAWVDSFAGRYLAFDKIDSPLAD